MKKSKLPEKAVCIYCRCDLFKRIDSPELLNTTQLECVECGTIGILPKRELVIKFWFIPREQ